LLKKESKSLPLVEKYVFLQLKITMTMKNIFLVACAVLMFGSCASQYNRVYKSSDYDYKYEYAKECFARGQFTRCISLLQEMVTIQKGTDNAQECLYMLAMAEYCDGDYESASATFKKYFTSYPKGIYAEQASYYIGQSLYASTPEPRLDQTQTIGAINAYQEFMDLFPDSKLRTVAQNKLFDLQDKLVQKEYLSAKLYYDLGGYFGNCTSGGSNYEACIITSQNALKTYPYSKMREDFAVLIMKSKYELAQQSIEAKKLDRYRDAEDECYGFINEYPESKERETAEKFIKQCKKVTKD
jgi:outer membrane protein assembly factor BamD